MSSIIALIFLTMMSVALGEPSANKFSVKIGIISEDGDRKNASLTLKASGECVGTNGNKKIKHSKEVCARLLEKHLSLLEEQPKYLPELGPHQNYFSVTVKFKKKTWSASIPVDEAGSCDAEGKNCTSPKPVPLRDLIVEILDLNLKN